MPFYRYKDPSYNTLGGTFPGTIGAQTYARINVVSEGVGGGDGSAPVDGAKAGPHPNAGTYLLAFGEYGISPYGNRGLAALAKNTDVLDDIVRENIPRRSHVDYSAPGSVSVTMTGLDVFVGDTAGTDPNEFVHVVDPTTGEQLLDYGGFPIRVSSIDNGIGLPVIGLGFVTSPRVNFTSAIPLPPAGALRLVYGARSSLARSTEVPDRDMAYSTSMGAMSRAIFAESSYKRGFDQIYRLSKGTVYGAVPETPGGGALMSRDGQAITFQVPYGNWTTARQYDPLNSCYAVRGSGAGASDVYPQYSGEIGFVNINSWSLGYKDWGMSNRGLAGFASLNIRSLYHNDGFTKLRDNHPGVVNPGGASPDLVDISVGWFRQAGKTSLLLGYDLLEIDFLDGTKQAFVITEIVSDTRVRVRTMGGATPTSSVMPANRSVVMTRLQPLSALGGGMTSYSSLSPKWGPLTVVYPTMHLDHSTWYTDEMPPCQIIGAFDEQGVFEIGVHDTTTGGVRKTLACTADGSVDQSYGKLRAVLEHRAWFTNFNTPGTYSVQVDPWGLGTSVYAGKSLITLNVFSDVGETFDINVSKMLDSNSDVIIIVRHAIRAGGTGVGTLDLGFSPDFWFYNGAGHFYPTFPRTVEGYWLFHGTWYQGEQVYLMKGPIPFDSADHVLDHT